MSSAIRTHLRDNLVAYVALFFALGVGTAWALDRNSVKSRHIANGQVRSADVADEESGRALVGNDIENGTLKAGDISPLVFALPRNPGSMANGACTSEVSAGPGVDAGDFVMVVPTTNMPSGFVTYGMVATEDAAPFRICNFSGATVDPPL